MLAPMSDVRTVSARLLNLSDTKSLGQSSVRKIMLVMGCTFVVCEYTKLAINGDAQDCDGAGREGGQV